MILSIITGVSLGIAFIAQMCLFWLRNLPPITFRDPYLTAHIGIVIGVYCSLMAFVYDSPEDQWAWRCKYFLGPVKACFNIMVGLPVVYRVFNIQFYYHSSESKFHQEKSSHFKNVKFLTTRKWQAIIISSLYVVALLTSIIIFHATDSKDKLPTSYPECIGWNLLGFTIQTVPLTFGLAYLILKFISFKDPFGIKFEFTCGFLLSTLGVPAFVVTQAVDILYKQFHNDTYQPILFAWAISLGYYLVSVLFPLYSAYVYEKRLQRSSSQTHITLDTVLDSPVYLESFKKQVAQFWCSEALLFLIDVKEYHSLPHDLLKDKAFTIIQEYIVEGSENQININVSDQKKIMSNYNSGEIYNNLFDSALRDVQDQLLPILIRWKQDNHHKDLENGAEAFSTGNIAPLKPIAH